ncbi:MAG: diacylglycerol kinase family lipid kinase [Anaerolineae bacterium]|nr:diacylglycerol kinase family lipid kinase [Anaerolineae bacterium]
MAWKKRERATLIYNPLAGPGSMEETIQQVALFWEQRGWEVTIAPTEYAGHAVRLAQDAAEAGEYLVLAAGGDGTLGEVANGLAGTDSIMGPLPIGTGNSFGKELRMPRPNLLDRKALVEAAALLASGRVQRMDLGRFRGGKYWMLWTGTGIDSFIVDEMEPRSKLSKRLGPAGYVAQALSVAPRFDPMMARVTVDGKLYEDIYLLVLISNCRLYGGGELLLNPDAALDDGLFEVFLFKGTGLPKTVTYLWQLWRGSHMGSTDVVRLQGREVVVDTERTIPVHTDGDPAGETPLRCLIVPGALRLLVARTAPRGLFRGPGLPL